MNIEIELMVKKSKDISKAKFFLMNSFTANVQSYLGMIDHLNEIIFRNYYIIYHVPIIDDLKPRARGIMCCFNVLILSDENEFIEYLKRTLDNKMKTSEWMSYFHIYRRKFL
jgi:hypothetical protein